MKRSEMIKKIHDRFVGCPIPFADTWATDLLNMMEEVGMEPPKYRSMPNSYNRSEGDYGYLVNEWEEENEA